jgi:hypothetical protein
MRTSQCDDRFNIMVCKMMTFKDYKFQDVDIQDLGFCIIDICSMLLFKITIRNITILLNINCEYNAFQDLRRCNIMLC